MEWIQKILVCFFAGAAAGIGTGFAGMSAAAVVGPILTVFLGVPAYQAIGIGLASDVLASATSAWTYKKHGNLDVKNSLVLLFTVLGMTVFGSYIATFVPERAMGNTMQIALILLGLKFFRKPATKREDTEKNTTGTARVVKSILGGCLVGFICGFIGAGGGMMLLFVLTSVLGYEMHKAVGTSVFIMAFTALTGSVSHFTIGQLPDMSCLVLCIVFTLIWAKIAAVIANRSDEVTLNKVVGVVLIVTSVIILAVRALG